MALLLLAPLTLSLPHQGNGCTAGPQVLLFVTICLILHGVTPAKTSLWSTLGFEVEVTAKGVSSPQAGVPLPPLGAWQSRLLRRNFLAGSSLLSWGPGRTLLTTIGAGGQGRGRVLGAARGSGSLHSPALEGLQVPPQGAASPLP